MAFNFDIRNLKDCKDFKNKREEFFRMLRLQAKLNRNYEQATIAREQMDTLGITPVVQARRSLEDERKDLILQQRLAMRNLQGIMKDEEASAVIQSLGEADMYFLNSEFGRLMEYLKGRTNITAEFFKRVLARFKVYLESTGMTGIPIPLRESTLEKLPGDLKDEWDNYARQTVDPLTGSTPNLEELMRRTAEALQRDVEDVKMEVESEQQMEEEQAVPPAPMETPEEMRGTKRKAFSKKTLSMKKPRGTIEERVEKRMREEDLSTDMPELKRQRTKGKFRLQPIADAQEDYVPYNPEDDGVPINPNTKGVKRGREVIKTLPDKKAKMETESAEMRGVKRQMDEMVDLQAQKFVATGGLTLEQAKRLARAQLEARQQMYVPPRAGVARTTGKRKRAAEADEIEMQRTGMYQRLGGLTVEQARSLARSGIEARAEMRAQELGQGLFMSPQRPTAEYGPGAATAFSTLNLHGGKVGTPIRSKTGKLMGKIGMGVMSNYDYLGQGKVREFGKYVIHMPSLQKCYVNVRYAGGKGTVASVPQKYVSQDFVNMLVHLLDNQVLDKALFSKLGEDEQQYFRTLANKCEFDSVIGLGMGTHLSQAEQKEQERFEMLRGTIIAGNNSPEVLKEMKMFILKFINEKRMPKQQGHDLLYEIACLS